MQLLAKSDRLKRVAKLLGTGREFTTRQIMDRARCCAVNSIVSELRAEGIKIVCTMRIVGRDRRWFYRQVKA